LKEFDDPELIRLAERLPAMLLGSRADSSARKYTGAFQWWKTWAAEHGLQPFPAQSHHVALYLQSIGDYLESVSAVKAAINALSLVHSLPDLPSPTSNPIVQETFQDIKRIWAKPVQK